MPEDQGPSLPRTDGSIRALLSVLGVSLLTSALQAILTTPHYGGYVEWPLVLLGLLAICLGIFWQPLSSHLGTAFVNRARTVASDFRWWIFVTLCVWLWAIVLPEIRRSNEILTLRNDIQSIARVIERGVLPRHLSKNQQLAIKNFLGQFDPYEVSFKVIARSEEASSYRADLQQAIVKAGWRLAAENPITYAEDVPEGLTLNFKQTTEHAQKSDDLGVHTPNILLQQALAIAGVRVNGMSSGSGMNETRDSLIISIGLPRKDTYELTSSDGP